MTGPIEFIWDAASAVIDLFFADSPSHDVVPTERELSDASFYDSMADSGVPARGTRCDKYGEPIERR